ncbi:MAG: TrkA family potassium uptake protein [Deltaproteobacteria bacterium]|nr:TrkA family potassium uptake protein [Deltaproteobacteria bacterium]
MQKQVLVIGLGQFGMSLAHALAARGMDVLAVDRNRRLVDDVAPIVARALAMDATDEEELARLEPARRDHAVCAIGPESREASIICTALLKQLGTPHIVARATDPLHERILRLVGAHEVLNPERAFGERLAARLAFGHIMDEVALGEDLVITEIRAPSILVGRTLVDLGLPRRFGLNVVAIRRVTSEGPGRLLLPRPDDPIQPEDILVLVGRPGAAVDLLKRV